MLGGMCGLFSLYDLKRDLCLIYKKIYNLIHLHQIYNFQGHELNTFYLEENAANS